METDSIAGRITSIERELEAVKEKVSRDREGFENAAGSWGDIDAEEFKERVREGREKSL